MPQPEHSQGNAPVEHDDVSPPQQPVGGISYDCEYNCGYVGTFDHVAAHEAFCSLRFR